MEKCAGACDRKHSPLGHMATCTEYLFVLGVEQVVSVRSRQRHTDTS